MTQSYTACYIDRDSDCELTGSGSYQPLSGTFQSYSGSGPNSGNYADDRELQRRLVQVDETLNCSVCLFRYTEPRFLICNHTFCKQCLENVRLKRVQNEDEFPCKNEIRCPLCNKVTQLDHGGIEALPKNYALKDVIEAMPPEQGLNRQQSVPICAHHNKSLDYYCTTDSVLICGDCVVDIHQRHNVVHANTACEKEKEKFQEICFEILEKERQRFKQALDDIKLVVGALREKGQRTEENIQEHFHRLRECLATREADMVRDVQKIVGEKVQKLLEQEEKLKGTYEKLDSEYTQCQQLLLSSPVHFLHGKDRLADSAKDAVKATYKVDRSPVEQQNQGPYWHHPCIMIEDTGANSGVFCDPVPSVYTAQGTGLYKAFAGKEAMFKIEARDKYGNKSFMKGPEPVISIIGPDKKEVCFTVDQLSLGEFTVSYTPSVVGWHHIKIQVNGEKIKNSEHRAIALGRKDYLKIREPIDKVSRSKYNFDPPVATVRGISLLPNDWIVFADSVCLRVIDKKHQRVCQVIGSYGNLAGQFKSPYDIAVTPQNHLFVTDVSNHRVQKFSPDGNFRFHYVTLFGSQGNSKQQLSSPEGLAVLGDDRVFIADKDNNRIQVILSKNMKHHASIGRRGDRAGYFNHPRDVVLSSTFMLVSDAGNKRIQALSFEGKPVAVFSGYNYISFRAVPSFIALDPDGFILVTYKDSGNIVILTPQGGERAVQSLNSKYLKSPFGICVDKLGNVVVGDSAHSHILWF